MLTFPNDQALSYARHVIRDILVDPDASRLNDVHLAALGQAMLAAALPLVLRAIREPSEAMKQVFCTARPESPRTVWHEVIDTALKEIEG